MNAPISIPAAPGRAALNIPVEEVSRRIRAARSYAGLSVAELAETIGVGVQTIKRIEAGSRNARRYEVWAIAEACEMPRDFFEVRFEDLLQRAETTTGMLRRLDERLARMESCLGVETRNVGSRAAVPAARS